MRESRLRGSASSDLSICPEVEAPAPFPAIAGLAVALLGERLTGLTALGAVLVLASLALLVAAPERPRGTPSPEAR